MKQRLRTFLQKCIEHSDLEARWLRTLSFLEWIGATKIAKSMSREHRLDILEHLEDESRHAALFYRASNTLNDSDTYLAKGAAAQYFHSLDHEVTALTSEELAYVAVSWCVEHRAMLLYPLYLDLRQKIKDRCEEAAPTSALRSVIEDEVKHRHALSDHLKPILSANVQQKIYDCEQRLFERFLDALELEVQAYDSNASEHSSQVAESSLSVSV